MDDRDTVLPIVPLVVRPAAAPTVSRPWGQRLMDALESYLPVFLMGLLALATWWLVKHTPVPQPERASAPLRHEADYEMHSFSVQRFAAGGPANNFADALKTALDGVSDTQKNAENLSSAYERGEVTDIAKVMLARQEAGVAFEATLQVRNRLLSAYQDIMRMGV